MKKETVYSFCCISITSGTYTATHTDTHHTQTYRHNAHTQTQAHIPVYCVGILSLEGTPKTGHVAAVTFPCYPFVLMECLHALWGSTAWTVDCRQECILGESWAWAVLSTHCNHAAAACLQVFTDVYKRVSRDGC